MIKLEEFSTSTTIFDCQENVNPWSCKKCGFSSQVLTSLVRHKEVECGNKVDISNFLLDAYKCKSCEFVSCSYIVTLGHEMTCCRLGSALSTSLWTCSHCEFTISYKSFHLHSNKFKCGYSGCNYSHGRMKLKEHAASVHLPLECLSYFFANDGNKQVEICVCSQCGEEFKRKLLLDRHRINKHSLVSEHTSIYSSNNKYGFRQHMNKHRRSVGDIKWFDCQECSYKSKLRTNLHRHKISKHSPPHKNIKWFECQECEFKAKTKCELNKHTISRHITSENIEWFECQECPYKAIQRTYLYRHKLSKHTPPENVRWFECQGCEFKAKTKAELNKHTISRHTPSENIKWFECQECEFQSKTRGGLRQHLIYKHTSSENFKWFKCELCEYKAKSKPRLLSHTTRRHTSVEKIKWFECEECGHKTKTEVELRRHKSNKHTATENIQWFECEECEYKSKTKGNLNGHKIRKHSAIN